MIEITQIQNEVGEWSMTNFGTQPSSNPLLGIGEELGELATACQNEKSRDEQADAVGDTLIYILDFCSREMIGFEDAVMQSSLSYLINEETIGEDPFTEAFITLGKIHHAYLKMQQKIRNNEDHGKRLRERLGRLFVCLTIICDEAELPNPLQCLETTWATVKARNWKSNPTTGTPTEAMYAKEN